jgi:Protein of unknown function (DUF4019)
MMRREARMNRVTTLFFVLITVVLVQACDTPEGPSPSQSAPAVKAIPKEKIPPTSKEDSTKDATAAIDAWLKLLDAAQYATCWEQSSAWLKQNAKKDDWAGPIAARRKAFGDLVSRKTKGVVYRTSAPEMPPGIYVSLTYDTVFSNVKDGLEEVSATYEDGKWRPLGYALTETFSAVVATPAPAH